jgi:ABC-type transport system substrate-binding protein
MKMKKIRKIDILLPILVALLMTSTVVVFPGLAKEENYFFEITMMLDPANIDAAEIMKRGWEEIGIKVNIVTLEFSTMLNRYLYGESYPGATYDEGGLDIALTGWGTMIPDSYGNYHSHSRIGIGKFPNYNMMMFAHGEVDDLLEEGLKTLDRDKSIKIYRRVEEIVNDELPIIYIFRDNRIVGQASTLELGDYVQLGSTSANLRSWDFHYTDKKGGEMVFIGDQNPPGLSAMYSITTVGVNNAYLIQEPLVAFGLPVGTFEGILAESWDISEDGKTYTFNLRENVKWQDGEAFDADDVMFTWDLFMNPEAGFSGHGFFAKNVKEVRKVDEHTVEMVLNDIYTSAIYRLATRVMLPEHILGDVNPSELKTHGFNKEPIGTGPWKVAKWVDDEYIQYERFDGYWRGTPKLDSIKFRVMPDKATGIAALQAGEIQCIFQQIYRTALIQNFETLEKNPDVKLIEYPPTGTNYAIINLEHPNLNNKFVRQAMAQAIDYEGIVEGVYNGHASRTSQWYSKLMEGYFNPDLEWKYDIPAAKEKMEIAGYKYTWLEAPTEVTKTVTKEVKVPGETVTVPGETVVVKQTDTIQLIASIVAGAVIGGLVVKFAFKKET